MKLLLLFITLFSFAFANNETTKISCIQQSEYPNKTLEEKKRILIDLAKRDALEELYGSLILSKTNIENGKLVSDEIKQKVIGAIRIKGNPKFYNGENFGEICSDIKAYITQKDLEKYSQKEVKLNNFCFNDTNVATKDIKQKAKEKAYQEIITKYKPSLKNISLNKAINLVHNFSISNDKFDFNTGSYCFNAVGSVYPYELQLLNTKSNSNSYTHTEDLQNGIKVSFYKKNDRNLKNKIYSTTIEEKSFYLQNVKFPREKISKNQVYLVKLEGFIKPLENIKELLLKYDVYDARLFIDGKEVITKLKPLKIMNLKKNKIYNYELLIKSANAYDISLLAKKAKSSNFTVLKNEEIYFK